MINFQTKALFSIILAQMSMKLGVRPHGNSKQSESYIRTMLSTLDKLTEVASEKTPKPSAHSVSSNHGGVVGALSAGSLPRNESQVKSILKSVQQTLFLL